jgi:membrane-bound lytic murein transglycosylase D
LTVIADAAKVTVPSVAGSVTTGTPTLNDTRKRSAQESAAAAPPPPLQQLAWYVVQKGDTLWNIARKFQISTQDLRQWNNLNNSNLQIGNKLIVKKG